MKQYVERARTYDEYMDLLDGLLTDGKTTGPIQSDEKFGFTKLNRQRMRRLEKTLVVDDGLRDAMRNVRRPMIWLVISEGWCGDGAQTVPVIEKIAAESDKIETRHLLRDENPELMDLVFPDAPGSIPRLIVLDAKTYEILGTWGPRPAAGQEYFEKMKADGIEKSLILEEMQRWYNADKGASLQREFESLINVWNGKSAASAAS